MKYGRRDGGRKLDLVGRGERIRTSDLSVPNHRFGKKAKFLPFRKLRLIGSLNLRGPALPGLT